MSNAQELAHETFEVTGSIRADFRRYCCFMNLYYQEDKGLLSSVFTVYGPPNFLPFVNAWLVTANNYQQTNQEMHAIYKTQTQLQWWNPLSWFHPIV